MGLSYMTVTVSLWVTVTVSYDTSWHLLQCVAACCSVLQRVAACCSVTVSDCYGVLWHLMTPVAACCSRLQRVAACCSVLQCHCEWLLRCHVTPHDTSWHLMTRHDTSWHLCTNLPWEFVGFVVYGSSFFPTFAQTLSVVTPHDTSIECCDTSWHLCY